ncbi:MAG: efflux RND transporter periplasmic adaptor subunit [Mariprofundales bacterium]|nr:efflux RND transporter periplasmic adaptor subunit [Mariprofundales bacterium]
MRNPIIYALLLLPILFTSNSAIAENATITATITLVPQSVPIHYVTSGTISSDHRVAIGSRLSGYISGLTVREGARVTKGELLFRIDPVDVRQQLTQAKADLSNAATDLNRFRALLKAKAVSRQQFDQAKLRFEVAQSKVDQARNQLNYAVVKSPLNGVVVAKRQHSGDLAVPGAPVLMIENTNNLMVDTYISEQFVPHIHIGNQAMVRIANNQRPVTAIVRQVVGAANHSSHQFLVKLSLPANSGARPGMFAKVAFITGTRQVLLLPASSIIHRHGLSGVYLVDNQSIAHWRIVRLGIDRGKSRIELAAGLDAGATIVQHPANTLRSGDKIQ